MDTKVATRMTIHGANRRPLSGRAVARAGYMLALVALLFITGCGSTQSQAPHLGIVDQALGGHAGGSQKITYPAPWSQKSTQLLDAFADKYMASMTLDQKLSQLFLELRRNRLSSPGRRHDRARSSPVASSCTRAAC
jgi:hypothetical protein